MKKSTVLKIISVLALAVFFSGCESGTTTDTVVIKITGRLPLVFTWNDARVDCPECAQINVTITAPERGDLVYGPFPFVFTGITIEQALSGSNRTIAVEITDAGGKVIYRAVREGITIIANTTNDPLFVELFPRGWHRQDINLTSTDWLLKNVDIESGATVWLAGEDRANNKGVVLKGTLHTYAANLMPAVASTDWFLNATAGSTWAVGENVQNGTALIFKNDGLLWNDNVAEPACSANCRLYSVSEEPGGATAWAAGEVDVGVGEPLIYRLVASVWTSATVPLGSVSVYSVDSLGAGDAVFGGKNKGTGSGLITMWDDSATSFVDYSVAAGIANPWIIDDVYGISAADWWAAGTENAATDAGIVLHYTTAGGLITEKPAGPAGSWSLTGLWADSSANAVAVGYSAGGAVILRRSAAGAWSSETIYDPIATWKLYSVDFTSDGWGIAVGEDTATARGLLLKYPFPR